MQQHTSVSQESLYYVEVFHVEIACFIISSSCFIKSYSQKYCRLLFHPEQPSCLRQHQAGQKTLEKKKSKLGLLCLLNVPKKYQIMRKWDKVLSVLPTLSYTYKIVLSVKCLILVWHDKICLSKPCFLLRIS